MWFVRLGKFSIGKFYDKITFTAQFFMGSDKIGRFYEVKFAREDINRILSFLEVKKAQNLRFGCFLRTFQWQTEIKIIGLISLQNIKFAKLAKRYLMDCLYIITTQTSSLRAESNSELDFLKIILPCSLKNSSLLVVKPTIRQLNHLELFNKNRTRKK